MATQTVSNATVTNPAPAPAAAPAPLTAEQIAAQAAIDAHKALVDGVVTNALANKAAILKAEALAIDATSTKGFNESLEVAKLYNLPLAFLRNWRPARSNSKDKCAEEQAVRKLHNELRPSDGPNRIAEVKDIIAAGVSCIPALASEELRATAQDVGNPSVSATDKKATWKTVDEARAAYTEAFNKCADQGERDRCEAALVAADAGDYAPMLALLREFGSFVSKGKTSARRWRAALILHHIDSDIRASNDVGGKWQPASERALKALHDLVSARVEKKLPAPTEEECKDAMVKAARDYMGLSNGGAAASAEDIKKRKLESAVVSLFNKLKYLHANGKLSDDGHVAVVAKLREYGIEQTVSTGNGKANEDEDEDEATDPAAQVMTAQTVNAAKVEAPAPVVSEDASAAAQVVAAVPAPASDGPVTSDPADVIAKARAAIEGNAVAPKPKGAATKASKLAGKPKARGRVRS